MFVRPAFAIGERRKTPSGVGLFIARDAPNPILFVFRRRDKVLFTCIVTGANASPKPRSFQERAAEKQKECDWEDSCHCYKQATLNRV
jgi:hypothetical protein